MGTSKERGTLPLPSQDISGALLEALNSISVYKGAPPQPGVTEDQVKDLGFLLHMTVTRGYSPYLLEE